jgi:hypothetical protein
LVCEVPISRAETITEAIDPKVTIILENVFQKLRPPEQRQTAKQSCVSEGRSLKNVPMFHENDDMKIHFQNIIALQEKVNCFFKIISPKNILFRHDTYYCGESWKKICNSAPGSVYYINGKRVFEGPVSNDFFSKVPEVFQRYFRNTGKLQTQQTVNNEGISKHVSTAFRKMCQRVQSSFYA